MRLFSATLCLAAILPIAAAQPAKPTAAPAATVPATTPQAVKLRSGFGFIEGPASDAEGNLYFVDMSTSRLYRLTPHLELDIVLEKTQTGAGLMFDKSGRLFMTQFAGAKLVEVNLAKRELVTVADAFEGKPFSNCNDLTIDSQGGIYFTDPLYKTPPHPQGKQSVYYASPDVDGKRTLTRVVDDDKQPNGVLLSPDEKTLYVVPAGRPALVAYPMNSPGVLGEKKEISLPGNGDGIAVDADGGVYVALPGKKLIQKVNPDLSLGASWPVPEGPANCEFGGPNLDTLYITARSGLYSLKLGVKGHRLVAKPALGADFPQTPAKFFCDITEKELLQSLRDGGNILVFRHGSTDAAQKDVPGATDREHQKSLTAEGRKQLEDIAADLKSLSISFTEAQCSPMFRARDTAAILFGKAGTDNPALASSGGKDFESLLTMPANGNRILVSHSNTLATIAPPRVRAVDPGCCLIYSLDKDEKFRCIAYLTPADWTRLANAPR